MTHVLDASVAVAALRRGEPHHASALRHCMPLFAARDDIVVPATFDVEVASAFARRGAESSFIQGILDRELGARRLVTIGPRFARAAERLVCATHLRAAHALYVSLAVREGLELVTLDADVLRKAGAVCNVRMP